ncbi:MAG: HNH endonuclease [Aureispira sp.]
MVHRKKDFTKPPSGLIDPKWDALKAALLVEQHAHKVKDTCYRDTTIDALALLYKDKCAICERKRGMELEVDHYRPKKPRNNKTNIEYNQPGYYWLAYTWSNLIPLCSKCNNNKSNKFPLSGWSNTNRVTSHSNALRLPSFRPYDLAWLQSQEQPFIIHPEVETQPERHFIFTKDGSIKGRTPEGKETIIICKLNRKDLRRERIEIRQDYVMSIKGALDDYATKHQDAIELKGELKGIFKRIKKNIHKDEAHSLYHIFVYNYFEYYIGSFIGENLRSKINTYFNNFKAL